MYANLLTIKKYCIVLLILLTNCFSSFGQTSQLEIDSIPYSVSSKTYDGHGESIEPELVWEERIEVSNIPWMRLQFGSCNLGNNSYIQITSVYDGSSQRLNSISIEEWYNKSAFLMEMLWIYNYTLTLMIMEFILKL